ncbi:hypothetical protein VTO42DRAFT_3602 [Malbranchea cinnamomea]
MTSSASDNKPASPAANAAPTTTPTAPTTATSTSSSSTTSAQPQSQQQPQPQQSKGSRRPSRKSTLTQQQKNQKRQRATHDQLVTLEMEFNKNPTPTAATRERIAEEINMTERSVQIWFQNRRAKIKMIAKKGLETGEDCNAVPESMRRYLALHLDPSKGHVRSMFNRTTGYAMNGSSQSGKIMINHFSCRSLRIGTWRRVGQSTMDLVIFYSPEKACMTYYINNDSAGYKIEYPFSYIKNIVLETPDNSPTADGSPPKTGGLVIELNRPPNFFMDPPNSGGFYQCGDFTEDQQATKCLVHHLGGHPKILSVQLAKLISLESFRNRHAHFDFSGFAASAPVSPHMINRPASQPNQPSGPPSGMYHEPQYSMSLHPPRGHKRQRSRSVPVPVDFSAMQTTVPAFHLQQHPSGQFQPNLNIYAPVPQSRPVLNVVNPNLRVDTSSSFNFDFSGYPMSATTPSSSEFTSPSFFACTAPPDQSQLAHLGPSYNLPFLSPSPLADQSSIMPSSASPLSQISHTEPAMANQSPPLSTPPQTSTDEMFCLTADSGLTMADDGLMLSELYSKQNLNMSIPSPGIDDPTFGLTVHDFQDSHSPANSVDYHGLLPFEALDPQPST